LYSNIVLLTGDNFQYSSKILEAIESNSFPVNAFCGPNATKVSSLQRLGTNPTIIDAEVPWLNSTFIQLISGSEVLVINGGISRLVPEHIINKGNFLNIHPSFLPYNKGSHHSFWGIREKTPLGASIHWMNKELDQGPILFQEVFHDDGFLTAEEIQKKSESLGVGLIAKHIAQIMSGEINLVPNSGGTFHRKSEILAASTLQSNDTISGIELWNLIRATRNGNHGFWIAIEDKKIHITCQIRFD
jgi:methionyl-tRNA formyltransferase